MPIELPIQKSLEALHQELLKHPDPRAKAVAGVTKTYLGQATNEPQAHHTLRDELQSASAYFRVKHPDLAGLLDRAVVQLAEMGI